MSETSAEAETLTLETDEPEVRIEPPEVEKDRDEAEFERLELSRKATQKFRKIHAKWKSAETERDRAEERALAAERRLAEMGQASLQTEEVRIAADLTAAQRHLAASVQAGDTAGISDATARIAELHSAKYDVSRRKQDVDSAAARVPHAPQRAQYSPAMSDWLETNEWFEKDAAMRGAATGFHFEAIAKGLRPESREYFAHIDKRIASNFPDHAAEEQDEVEEPAPRPQQRASQPAARRAMVPATSGARSTVVRLSAQEIEVANSLGMTPKEYAESKQQLKARGEMK